MVNNLSESFNSMIVKAKDKPILSMLEWIRVRLMSMLYIKKTGIEKYGGKLCPNIQKKLEQFADDIGRPEDLNLVFINDKQKVLSSNSCL